MIKITYDPKTCTATLEDEHGTKTDLKDADIQIQPALEMPVTNVQTATHWVVTVRGAVAQ